MDNDIAFELVDHVCALAKWVLDYIEKHDLPIVEDNEWMRFDFHLNRFSEKLDTLSWTTQSSPDL